VDPLAFVQGTQDIERKYLTLGGPSSVLGQPVSNAYPTPTLPGVFQHFENGSIYWSAITGAYEVHGAIGWKWAELGWEQSFLGFPVTDELVTPDGRGRHHHFEGGSIYWTPATEPHEVHGAIRDTWAALGWELGRLGYPVSDEYSVPACGWGGRRSDFQGGYICWTSVDGTRVVFY
jgi:uncharacterized protein with LGFP repeats